MQTSDRVGDSPNRFNEPEYDQFIAGKPGQSNWPSEYLAQFSRKTPKLQPGVFLIDVQGETMSRAADSKGAKFEARRLQVLFPGAKIEIRYYEESEEDAEDLYQKLRKEQWETIVYKKSPARRSR